MFFCVFVNSSWNNSFYYIKRDKINILQVFCLCWFIIHIYLPQVETPFQTTLPRTTPETPRPMYPHKKYDMWIRHTLKDTYRIQSSKKFIYEHILSFGGIRFNFLFSTWLSIIIMYIQLQQYKYCIQYYTLYIYMCKIYNFIHIQYLNNIKFIQYNW